MLMWKTLKQEIAIDVPIINGELGTIPKSIARRLEELEIGGRSWTIQTTELLRAPRILRNVLKTCSFSDSSISHLFALTLNVKQFYLTHRYDPVRCYNFGTEWTWQRWLSRGILHSPKFQHYWSLTIRLFSVIYRTLVGRILHLCRDAVDVFYSPSWLGHRTLVVGRSYLSAAMLSVYSSAPANWVINPLKFVHY